MLSDTPVICIVGPTASGKSDVAQILATRINGEVISADSMQIYKGMNIGTGKLAEEARVVAHYGLDLVEPGIPYSVALFQEYARRCIDDIAARNKYAILAGGTGLYIDAVVDDFQFPRGDQAENPVREQWTQFLEEHGSAELWEKLNEVDGESAALIHPNNTRRVIRAFEMLADGSSYAEQNAGMKAVSPYVPALYFGLQVDPDLLRERICARVDCMVEAGLVSEVENLLEQGFREGLTAPQAIGYKEIVAYLEGTCSLDAAIESIKTATCRYAKRQRTWFRRNDRIVWLDANDKDANRIAEEIAQHICHCVQVGE